MTADYELGSRRIEYRYIQPQRSQEFLFLTSKYWMTSGRKIRSSVLSDVIELRSHARILKEDISGGQLLPVFFSHFKEHV